MGGRGQARQSWSRRRAVRGPSNGDKRRPPTTNQEGDGRVGLYAGSCTRPEAGGDHPSRPAVADRLQRPTRRLGRAALERLRRPCGPLGLAPGGVYRATPVTRGAGGLLPHRFTLTGTRPAVSSLWHFPAGHPGLPLATTLLYGVRTFLGGVPGGTPTRPPGRLVRRETILPTSPGPAGGGPSGDSGPRRT